MQKLPFFNSFVDESKPAIYWQDDVFQTYGQLIDEIIFWIDCLKSESKKLIVLYVKQHPQSVALLAATLASKHAVLLATHELPSERRINLESCYQPHLVIEFAADGYTVRETKSERFCIHPDLCLLLSTSGSTGAPKSVKLTAENVLSNAESIKTVLDINSDHNALVHLDLSYSYGLSVVTSHLLAGGALTVTADKLTDKKFWNTVANTKVTHFPGVPYHYETMCRLRLEKLPLENVRSFTQAGGRLPDKFREMFMSYASSAGSKFYIMYGQTEAAPRMSTLQPEMYPKNKDSVGQALPGGEFLIKDDNGTELPVGSDGKIVYRGPNVMLGYATCRDDLAIGDELEGELHTGDTGFLNDGGFLTVTGRDTRMGKLYGWRINLDDIEKELEEYFKACVVQHGNHLYIGYLDADDKQRNDALKKIIEKFSLPVSVFKFHLLDSIPVNSRNKIDYKLVLEMINVKVQR